ncbi:MAG: 3-deoxy-7-phosphoheptulonate synthase [Alphaproteobacteria bacterium CG_4_10_14_0_2_um_filter_63_37]|nr:MAG: 3-deoxy-7-phosphoheptulonate synthase [Proteobacteria bacterium CG1_02_64_396]PJA23534.1 MAG: 3-deoxy-7-phosphoheptulonate synthase [Alphaproteobacteria bacterium CG_4_10_14_0_2_um_filter_63_37]
MVIVMRPGAAPEDLDRLLGHLRHEGFTPHVSQGTERTIIGVIGDERGVDEGSILAHPGVESVTPILKPYKLVSRDFRKEDTVIKVRDLTIGGNAIQVIAGPCSVESEEQLDVTAEIVRSAGATMMRGGAFKPRTSPYTFQGLGPIGLTYLSRASHTHGLPVVTELMDVRDINYFVEENVDVIQIGTRNMQNFQLLKEVGKLGKPVILKRGMAATIKEWLMSAEYIASEGNLNIILAERGIRTYETATRNTLDLSAIPVLKELTHLPVIVDPSHAVGIARHIPTMAKAAVAAGADGLLIEVHHNPCEAMCDGDQALTPEIFRTLMKDLDVMAAAVGRTIAHPKN